MSYSKEDLSKYRIGRAKESLEEAKILGNLNHWNMNAFNKELIKTGLLESKYGLLYNKLFNLRQDADNRDYRDVTNREIKPMINQVEDLIEQIEVLLNSTEEE